MTKRNIAIGVALIIVIGAFFIIRQIQDVLTFPTSEEAGVSFQTIQSELPENSECLNDAGRLVWPKNCSI